MTDDGCDNHGKIQTHRRTADTSIWVCFWWQKYNMGNFKSYKYWAIISKSAKAKLPEDIQLKFSTPTGERITHQVDPKKNKEPPHLIQIAGQPG